jgi:hypothetical protein
MSGIMNLESALRTCKVDTAYQQKIQSDRFLNPRNAVCPVWNGLDTAGRVACKDSFNTKREGCNSALDRVGVENVLRPQYMQYISSTLEASYNQNSTVAPPTTSSIGVEGFMDFETPPKIYSQYAGNFSNQMIKNVYPRTCSARRYDEYSDSVMM